VPCLALKQASARPRAKREQTLGLNEAMMRRSQFYCGGRISVLYFARSQLSILLLGRVTRKLR